MSNNSTSNETVAGMALIHVKIDLISIIVTSGVQRNNGEYWHKHKKHETGNEEWLSENFLSNSRKICHHFAFVVHQKPVP